MAVLITGCCGTTGTSLTKFIMDNDPNELIIGVDNFYKEGSRANLKEIEFYAQNNYPDKVRFLFHEIGIETDQFYNYLDDLLNAGMKINGIYNLAAIVETPRFYDSPYETHLINCTSAIRLYEYACVHGIKKFVNASSSEIYGHALTYPTTETDPQCYDSVEKSTRWSYAHGKILTEYVMNQLYNKYHSTEVCHLRYANVYGEHDITPVHVIPYFLDGLFNHKEIHMNKYPSKFKRAFLHNDDSTLGTYLAMKNMVPTHAYNIGSDEEVTILELFNMCVKTVKEITGIDPEYILTKDIERPGDPVRRVLDTTRAKSELGFTCKVSLEHGIRLTALRMFNELKRNRSNEK